MAITSSLVTGISLQATAIVIISPLILVSLVYFFAVPNSLKDSRRRSLPPGPRGLPFIGNLLDLADSDLVRGIVTQWARTYGDIFYTKIGGSDYVWLSSPKVVKDLLDKKSAIYSSRAALPLAQDVASAGRRQLFMQYGSDWRKIRKASHALLNSNTAIKYQPIQDFESKQLLVDFLDTPENFYEHNRRYSASVIMLVTYGYRLPTWDDPLVKEIYEVLDNLTEMTAPGAHAVDSFPSLAKLPQFLLGNWRSFGQRVFEHDSKVYIKLWERLKQEVNSGIARDCFCKTFYLNDPAKQGIDDLLAAYTCGGLVEAGSETTSTTLNNFILALLLFPETAVKAQEEIDKVVGSKRLPTFEDEKNLPYVRAMVKEVLRWRAVNKFGMMHATSEDDWYEGYFIPKGTVAVLNWWAIHMNPELFGNPQSFDPSRYLEKNLPAAEYLNSNDPYERDHFTYGAGRRVCPGVHVAERSLYINIVRTLWGFDINKAKDTEAHSNIRIRSPMAQPVAIVTGGASGIGLAVAQHLLSKDYRVVIADINKNEGEIVATRLGINTIFQQTDVSSFQDQRALFDRAFTWGGNRLDFFAANAGVDDRQSLYQVQEELDENGLPRELNLKALRVDLDAVFQGIWLFKHYARKGSNPGGKVVITSSAAGLYPMATNPQYTAAKHALVGLTRSCGPVFLQENITVNCICPAFVPTNLCPPHVRDLFPREHITPMTTVIKAFDIFLDSHDMSGETVELTLDELHFRKQPDYPNESQKWLGGDESMRFWEDAYKTLPVRPT
ncbi:cytochrome P450 oxidoreductase [Phlyctema vagabunda]|uniref:Cytochrome P450 oxidoreductase n=1 Tax=Phlyctema vagabunda TaxID=108571 RepID=A0ABR4PTK4_9HELO